jgi:hypothetical protein
MNSNFVHSAIYSGQGDVSSASGNESQLVKTDQSTSICFNYWWDLEYVFNSVLLPQKTKQNKNLRDNSGNIMHASYDLCDRVYLVKTDIQR